MMSKKIGLIAVLVLGAFGCVDDTVENDPTGLDCGPGQSAEIDGVALCIIENDLLIETGFMCGPELERYEGETVTICAEAPLSDEQLAQLEGFAPPPPEPEHTRARLLALSEHASLR